MRNSKSEILCSLADSVLKFSTKIDAFIKHPKNGNFLHCSIDSLVQCYPEKANLIEIFVHGI